MSYLSTPRIHFVGRFQADTSTINNDVRHFDDDLFVPAFQELMDTAGSGLDTTVTKYNGYWNPEGSGAWRMLGCKVTAAVTDGSTAMTHEQDAAVGMLITGAQDRVAGKLVDLDPQQQMVSQIWGMAVQLQDADGNVAFGSEFEVAPFSGIWRRQQNVDQFLDQTLAAAYQSELGDVCWGDVSDSPCLAALRAQSAEGRLSIRMNVYGFDRTPGAPDFGTGVAVGTIGPADSTGPKRFVLGRQLVAAVTSNPMVPQHGVSNAQAIVCGDILSMDLGNALPIEGSSGKLVDIGEISIGVLKDPIARQGAKLTPDQIDIMGGVPYLDEGWYERTAGVIDFDLGAKPAAKASIRSAPLAIVSKAQDKYEVRCRETGDGLYVRADNYVFRLNAGEHTHVDFFASQYGEPLATQVVVRPTTSQSDFMGGAGTLANLPKEYEVPEVREPLGILTYDDECTTGADGHGTLTIHASEDGPGRPRKYMDGQLYGIAYQVAHIPAWYVADAFNYVSCLCWDACEVPKCPTWHDDVRPLLVQFGNLYPIMSKRLVVLSDYDSVVANLEIMKLAFSLPVSNPNYMPVTRDLSARKRECIVKWLNSEDPATGLPPKGVPAATKEAAKPTAPPRSEDEFGERDIGGKEGFMREVLAHNRRRKQ